MGRWRTRTIVMIWLGWTALLALAGYVLFFSTLISSPAFASLNIALPLPTAVSGHHIGATAAMVAAIMWVLLWLYLPPILFTLSWLVARRSNAAR